MARLTKETAHRSAVRFCQQLPPGRYDIKIGSKDVTVEKQDDAEKLVTKFFADLKPDAVVHVSKDASGHMLKLELHEDDMPQSEPEPKAPKRRKIRSQQRTSDAPVQGQQGPDLES